MWADVGFLGTGWGDVGAPGRVLLGDAEVHRGLLQPVAGHLARRDVVLLHEQVGVDHRPPRQVAAREIEPALRELEPAAAEEVLDGLSDADLLGQSERFDGQGSAFRSIPPIALRIPTCA